MARTSKATGGHQAGCSKRTSSKAATSEEARRRTLRYVELLSEARTPLGERCVSARRDWAGEKSDFFSILIEMWKEGPILLQSFLNPDGDA